MLFVYAHYKTDPESDETKYTPRSQEDLDKIDNLVWRAEPWQAAAAAKGATATTSAVAGTAGAGSLSKGDGVAGKKGPSPAFDPSTQIGAMAPLGFFDPAGQELQLSR